jgi:seryl-tRNA synthetase
LIHKLKNTKAKHKEMEKYIGECDKEKAELIREFENCKQRADKFEREYKTQSIQHSLVEKELKAEIEDYKKQLSSNERKQNQFWINKMI